MLYILLLFYFFLIFILFLPILYIFSCAMFHFFLHCPLSGLVLIYISLLVISCIIEYVMNKRTLNLDLEPTAPTAMPCAQTDAPLPSYLQDFSRWKCSLHQRIWMKTEMEFMGLWPGSHPLRRLMNMVSLWRYPPQPELIETNMGLPSPKYFQLHPF